MRPMSKAKRAEAPKYNVYRLTSVTEPGRELRDTGWLHARLANMAKFPRQYVNENNRQLMRANGIEL